MKRISKILSVLMVAVMLFSFTAVPASAADYPIDNTSKFKYVFKDKDGNTITKAAKGDDVWLHVYINWDMNVLNFQGMFKWDKNALTLQRKNGGAAPARPAQAYEALGSFASKSTVDLTAADGEIYDQAYNEMGAEYYSEYGVGTFTIGYDYTMNMPAEMLAQYQIFTFIYSSSIEDSTNQLMVNTHGADMEVMRIRFLVNADTTLTEAVISDDAAFNKMNIADKANEQEWYFAPLVGANCTTYRIYGETATLNIGSTAPSVAHDKTMGQMKSWASLTGPFNGGLVGRISNLDLTFDENDNCNEIKKIEVTIATSTGPKSAEAYTVYKQADGSYLFRAVIKNMPITDEETLTCTYAVTRADDTVIYSDPFTTTAKQMYETALANYTAANP